MASMKRALISVSDKTGVVDLAKGLAALGAEILSTGGTAKTLRDAGVAVTDVAAYTGSPEILDGRVKTLHPKIHGGLLGRRSVPAHVEQMKEHHIGPIDMVVVNLYPFEATIARPNCQFDDAIENIDIGGPSMLRAAAKNFEDVTVVVDSAGAAAAHVCRAARRTAAPSASAADTVASTHAAADPAEVAKVSPVHRVAADQATRSSMRLAST